MKYLKNAKNEDLDFKHAVQLDDSIWWVGHYLPEDPFQCHVYLIEDGDNSVLVDPGSKLTFAWTLQKIEEIIPFSHIKYFILKRTSESDQLVDTVSERVQRTKGEIPRSTTNVYRISELNRLLKDSLEAVVERADRALYLAKAGGRNQIIIGSEI